MRLTILPRRSTGWASPISTAAWLPERGRQIKDAKSNPHCNTRDPWGSAIQVIFRFFDSLLARATDLGVLDDLDKLQPEQRDKILRHLDVFLKGPIENDMWERERKRAEDVRSERDRENRVWKFFVPAPVGPRIRQPVQPTITMCRWITAALPVLLLAAAGGYLGWELLWHGSVFGLGNADGRRPKVRHRSRRPVPSLFPKVCTGKYRPG